MSKADEKGAAEGVKAGPGDAWTKLAEKVSGLSRRNLAWWSLALGAVILLSVNLISGIGLRNWKGDLTRRSAVHDFGRHARGIVRHRRADQRASLLFTPAWRSGARTIALFPAGAGAVRAVPRYGRAAS